LSLRRMRCNESTTYRQCPYRQCSAGKATCYSLGPNSCQKPSAKPRSVQSTWFLQAAAGVAHEHGPDLEVVRHGIPNALSAEAALLAATICLQACRVDKLVCETVLSAHALGPGASISTCSAHGIMKHVGHALQYEQASTKRPRQHPTRSTAHGHGQRRTCASMRILGTWLMTQPPTTASLKAYHACAQGRRLEAGTTLLDTPLQGNTCIAQSAHRCTLWLRTCSQSRAVQNCYKLTGAAACWAGRAPCPSRA